MKKRILAALLLCALLASCNSAPVDDQQTTNDTTIADTTTTTAPETEPELTPDLPDVNYDGKTITLFQRAEEKFINDIAVDEDNEGDIMQHTVYERNLRLSEQYGVDFKRIIASTFNGDDGKAVLQAGDNTWDLLNIHARLSFAWAGAGLTQNWNTALPYVNLDNPWWAQDARESLSIANKLFVMTGDISYMNLASTNVMLFNKAIFDELNMEYPYQTVLDGNWTFEEFQRLATLGASDLDGNGSIDMDTDRMGYGTNQWMGPIQVLYAGGERICEKDKNDEIILTLNTEGTINIFEWFFNLTSLPGMYINLTNDNTQMFATFREGRQMFLDMNVGDTMNFRDMDDDFGIIPWPKVDETKDGYLTGVDAGCNMLAIPVTKNAEETEMLSVILEAMAYDSYKNVIPVYYDVVLQSKYARDPQSSAMIDLISESRVYDIGYFYDNNAFISQINSVGRVLAQSPSPNFASHYATYESAALAALDKINETYRNMD